MVEEVEEQFTASSKIPKWRRYPCASVVARWRQSRARITADYSVGAAWERGEPFLGGLGDDDCIASVERRRSVKTQTVEASLTSVISLTKPNPIKRP